MKKRPKLYSFNEHLLDKIDTHEKAYILGLLYADGCNHVEKRDVSLTLNKRDEHIINSVREAFDTIKPVYKDRECRKFMLRSFHLSRKLESFGMVARKSLILKFPTEEIVSTEFINSFILGLFDGDGTIYHDGRKCVIGFSGSMDIVNQIQRILIQHCNVNKNKIYSYRNIYIISFARKKDVESIIRFMYKDSSIFLIRKKEKAMSCDCEKHMRGGEKRKLTDVQVIEIRKLLNEKTTKRTSIAKDYGISPQILTRINKGLIYKNV